MKKLSILIFVFAFAKLSLAQQFPLQSQYQFNYSAINPATTGENDFLSVRASFREQWKGLLDNPISTQIFSVTKGFDNNGLGFSVFSDKTGGAFNKTGASVSYSHKVKFESSNLFFGVSAGLAKINLNLIDDPAIILADNGPIPEFTFGMYYKIRNFKFGFSVPGLLNANMNLTNSNENTIDRHYYTMLSYEKKLDDNWTVFPSMLLKTTTNYNQIDANVNFKLKDKIWFGGSYRQDFGPTIYVGIDFGKLFSVYSFDISTNEVSDYSSGSHEFTIGYDFIPNNIVATKKVKEKVINDRDKDGVVDSLDMCPDRYGSEISYGCPDSDKDGVPDKYDLCPNLFGDIESSGCPSLTDYETNIISEALKGLIFDFDNSSIKYESYPTLTNLVKLMLQNPAMRLSIEGHASSEGDDSYNLSLSAKRAKSVQEFFKSRGVSKSRLLIDFYGESSPLNSNLSEEERSENRRVEFEIKYHVFDKLKADILKNEFDSMINLINGVPNIKVEETSYNSKDISTNTTYERTTKSENTAEILNGDTSPMVDKNSPLLDSASNSDKIDETVEIVDAETLQIVDWDSVSYDRSTIEKSNSNKDLDRKKYIVVVQVFSSESNALTYINKENDDNLMYQFKNNSYYVFAFSSADRLDCEEFRRNYASDCWILEL